MMTSLLPSFWSETLKKYSAMQITTAVETMLCSMMCCAPDTWINQGCILSKAKGHAGCNGEGFQQSMAAGGRKE